ncbi:MAG TPA: MFS transporter [Nocardioidaceae bacterium]|nr:MFS transporter [Nocardioidaceae bacterium]
MSTPRVEVDRDQVQRRTVAILTVTQALGGLGIAIGIAVAAVLAEEVSGSESKAGLAQTFQVLGTAFASYALARVMGVYGRRIGLVLGFVAGAAGALLCVLGGQLESLPVLLLGLFLLGTITAANLQSRYAAADLARPEHRARALSTVVWATTIGAVLGPNLAGASGNLAESLGLPSLTGPFLITLVATLVAVAVVGTMLRPDPLLLARELEGVSTTPPTGTSWSRVKGVLGERPAVVAGVLALSSAHAVMVGVMVMTPIHMKHGDASLNVIGMVISVHVLGMFAFAPFVGALTDRIGAPRTITAGGAMLALSMYLAGSSPEGSSWQIFAGLFLLGLGWSFCTVAGSALLTAATPIEARTDIQGAADLIMNLSAASAGALAGVVVGWRGFDFLNLLASVLLAGVVVAVVLARDTSHLTAASGGEPAEAS